ncbi:hypothetical protein GGR95_001480 [Sulfitobacter undariae]|uniref:EF-hand domain-containing protein n=1 Tax=Sulfitobacter undariae TaxID=1563671 RepID=A0A7W6E3Z3_9RHOB|nr:hypothetical protein [Sulfitobacter undariae]MBB3993849.1 hypothetical protein [Sulfitobacter undariae]
MTNLKTLAAVAVTALCVPAFAMAQDAVQVDANADGVLSLEEMQTVYPEITAEQFTTLDLNADGALDDAEVKAAQEAGLIPAE